MASVMSAFSTSAGPSCVLLIAINRRLQQQKSRLRAPLCQTERNKSDIRSSNDFFALPQPFINSSTV